MLVPSIFGDYLLDGLFNDYERSNGSALSKTSSTGFMKTDIKEHENAYELDIELPGYSKDDITAQLKDGYLTVSAKTETNSDEKSADGTFLRRERYTGACTRSFYVGKDVTQDDIQAKFEQGILSIDIPKIEKKPELEKDHFISIAG